MVATFSILGDVVQIIGGDAIDLTTIVGPDGDAHTFEPKPDQMAALANADLIFENGLGFEPWLDEMYSAQVRPRNELRSPTICHSWRGPRGMTPIPTLRTTGTTTTSTIRTFGTMPKT